MEFVALARQRGRNMTTKLHSKTKHLISAGLARAGKDSSSTPRWTRTGPVIGCSESSPSRVDGVPGLALRQPLVTRRVDPFDDHCSSLKTTKKLMKDIGLSDCGDCRCMALLWRLGAQRTDRISREKFIEGCLEINVDCVERLSRELPNILYDAKRNFREFYLFVFKAFARTEMTTVSNVDAEGKAAQKLQLSRRNAELIWREVLPICSGDALRFEAAWYEFLEHDTIASIDEKCWMSFLCFSQAVLEDLSNFDMVKAQWWSSILQEFVSFRLTSDPGTVHYSL